MPDEVPPEESDPDIIRGVGLQGAPIKAKTPDQLRFWKAAEHYWIHEGAYARINMTRPQGLSSAVIVPIIRSQAEKYFNVVRFNEFPRGEHFAIHEQAEAVAEDIRAFFRSLRTKDSSTLAGREVVS